jgi:hypothetical protein
LARTTDEYWRSVPEHVYIQFVYLRMIDGEDETWFTPIVDKLETKPMSRARDLKVRDAIHQRRERKYHNILGSEGSRGVLQEA